MAPDFEDQFASVDPAKWYPCYPYSLAGAVDEGSGGSWNAGTAALGGVVYNPYSIVSDGTADGGTLLRVSCRRTTVGEKTDAGGKDWVGGIIISHTGWTSGYAEWRVRFPSGATGTGTWPALWLFGQTQNSADQFKASRGLSEMDMLEIFGVPGEWSSTIHDVAAGGAVGNDRIYTGSTDNAWHTYGVEWDGDTVLKFYYDGALTATGTGAQAANFAGQSMCARMNHTVTNSQGWIGITTDASTPSPLYFDVDYFKHYAAKPEGPLPVAPLTGTLIDTFANLTKWTGSNGASVVGGRARITTDTDYNALRTGYTYNLKGSQIQARMWPPAAGGAATAYSNMVMEVPTAGTDLGFEINVVGGVLRCYNRVGYADAGEVTLTYDPVAHAYLRLRESGGTLYWETSPNSTTWTNRRTTNAGTPAWVTDGTLSRISIGTHRDAGTNDYAEIDDFNVSLDGTVTATRAAGTSAGRPPLVTAPAVSASVTASRAAGSGVARGAVATSTKTATIAATRAVALGQARPGNPTGGTVTSLPAAVTFGSVKGWIATGVNVAPDADGYADMVAAVGTITFTPVKTVVLIPGASPAPLVLAPKPVITTLDSEGYLIGTKTAEKLVRLIIGQWKVTSALVGITLPEFTVTIVSNTILDLTEVIPT